MRVPLPNLAGAVALATAAAPALAHDGHAHGGLLAGIAHPLGGVDHLLATVGLGLVAGLARAHRLRAAGSAAGGDRDGLPLRAAAAGALGLAAGAIGWALGAGGGLAEQAVAIGLLAIAAALLSAERLGPVAIAALALAVALPHGWLHASEGTGAAFFTGLALASAALFAAGAGAGRALAAAGRAGSARWIGAAGYAGAFAWVAAAGLR